MKTNRILTLLITSVMFAVSSPRTQAAEISVDISSYAPRNAKVILRQIELNVAIKQYEKTLMLLHEIHFEVGAFQAQLQGWDRERRTEELNNE